MSPTKEVFAAYCDLPFIEVEKYMRGKLTWDELRKLAEERKCPVGFVGRGLVCVLEKSSCGAQVMAFCTVASGPNLRREMPGLGLRQRGDSDFHYTSFWKYRLPDDVLIVHVECDWLEVLCRLQYKSIRTILPFLDWMCGWRRIYIEQELDAKCMLFDMKFRVGYFQDGEDILAWHVAENWNAWEMGKITIERRLKMVASCFDVEFSKREFDSLCPSSQLSMHRERRARLRRLACSVAVLHKLCGVFWGDSGENVVPLGVSFRGGHPLEFLAWSSDWNRTSLPRYSRRSFDITFLEEEGTWWWRYIDRMRGPEFPMLFKQEYENSALFYELRARQICSQPATWDFFARPWLRLDSSERAVLNCLCEPPDLTKPPLAAHHWRDSRHEEEIRHIFEVKVDLTKREGEVENQIKKSVKMLSTARWHLLGLESLRGSNKRERLAAKERGEVNQISPDWLVVEAMDGQKHADLTLNGSLRTNRLRLLKWYTDACDELGVDPKGGVGFGEAYSIWPEDLELEGGPG